MFSLNSFICLIFCVLSDLYCTFSLLLIERNNQPVLHVQLLRIDKMPDRHPPPPQKKILFL